MISRASVRWDRVEKLQGYSEIGVTEYWIVDPERRTLERFLLGAAGTYRPPDVLTGDTSFAPATFPGLVLDLAELWRLPDWFEA